MTQTDADAKFQEIMAAATKAIADGTKTEQLAERWRSSGVSSEAITYLLEYLRPFEKEFHKQQGRTMVRWGAGILAVGLAVTGATYLLGIGGRYIIMTGAFGVGGVFLIVGSIKALTGWRAR